ncbi:aromatic-ring hydroxylase C-terminal domain-containing protein [Pseudoduganella armeniaca]|uniref:aromatic-ring hydroxylase C-terminal domain-containing protein n=1 Tax=Pseudoduganella armeniaca TaxID=2072590 RepID=UPI0035305DEF
MAAGHGTGRAGAVHRADVLRRRAGRRASPPRQAAGAGISQQRLSRDVDGCGDARRGQLPAEYRRADPGDQRPAATDGGLPGQSAERGSPRPPARAAEAPRAAPRRSRTRRGRDRGGRHVDDPVCAHLQSRWPYLGLGPAGFRRPAGTIAATAAQRHRCRIALDLHPAKADPGAALAQPDDAVVLSDLDGVAHGAYGMDGQPALVLIRPDGHIAFRAPAAEAALLVTYCNKVFGATNE